MDSSLPISIHRVLRRSTDAEEERRDERKWSVREPDSDDLLLLRINGGDSEALGLLFRRYAGLVRNIGGRILGDRGEADDLVQEVFLYLHRKSGLFDKTRGVARSWIIQVAYTQALLRRRALKANGFYASGIPDGQIESHQRLSAGAPNYDRSIEGLFGRNGWRQVVEELTEDQRETLRLHFFEGLTFAEIAEKLGQSHRNVRNHHYRGLEKLRKHIVKCELNGR
ncbi:MAG: sigma-70 family RNA polymerase sigma factor [Acidobacteria bacterium]|nr:sigma-70 family RNA polymerase sigma factor [Acidobacteriota bacterium]MBS1867822.1 sigma-70 family RNA polymerase sigma factor [Acidobacteriota bacterium]